MNKNTETTPINNIIRTCPESIKIVYDDFLYDIKHRDRSINCVNFHKQKLGRQQRTWVGSSENRRFYIWENDNWRVYVHNTQGASFEVLEGITVAEAMKAWQQYRDKIK